MAGPRDHGRPDHPRTRGFGDPRRRLPGAIVGAGESRSDRRRIVASEAPVDRTDAVVRVDSRRALRTIGVHATRFRLRRGEPIVETPTDAFDALLGLGLDGLFIDGEYYRPADKLSART